MKKILSAYLVFVLIIASILALCPAAGAIASSEEYPGEICYSLFSENEQSSLLLTSGSVDVDLREGIITASYTLKNASNQRVKEKLLLPTLHGNGSINVSCKSTDVKTRHTLAFNDRSSARARIESIEGSSSAFIRPDTTVTKYTYTVTGTRKDELWAISRVGIDMQKSAIFIESGFYTGKNDKLSVKVENSEFSLYVVGQPLSKYPGWGLAAKPYDIAGTVSGKVSLKSTETMTFESLAMRHYTENSGVNRDDWFNAILSRISGNKVSHFNQFDIKDSLVAWQIFEIELGAGESAEIFLSTPFSSTHTYPSTSDIDYSFCYAFPAIRCADDMGDITVTVSAWDDLYQCSDGVLMGNTVTLSSMPEELRLYFGDGESKPSTSPIFIILLPAILFLGINVAAASIYLLVILIINIVKRIRGKKRENKKSAPDSGN